MKESVPFLGTIFPTNTTMSKDQLYQRLDDEHLSFPPPLKKRRTVKPRILLGCTFFLLILIGSFLLLTPWAQASGRWAWLAVDHTWSWTSVAKAVIDNCFMGTSAACVTGLGVVTISEYYTFFGQTVLLLMIQLGGLGIMTVGAFFMLIIGLKLTAQDESAMMVTFGTQSRDGVRNVVRKAIKYVVVFELIGAALLYTRYRFHYDYPVLEAVWFSVFHAISAFCNAGLSLHPENLLIMANDPYYLATVASLIIIGGLGFIVLANFFMIKFWRRDLTKRGRLSLHSKIVVRMTFWLVIIGALLFAIFEWHGVLNHTPDMPGFWETLLARNWTQLPDVLSDCGQRISLSFFQSITPRTAGFTVVPMTEISQAGNFLTSILMLIGGSPGSMAGGVKTTSVVVIYLTMRAMIRGQQETETNGRTLPFTVVREATVIVFVYLAMVFITYFILLWSEEAIIAKGGMGLLFEVISAYGTVGLSLNNTCDLTYAGRCIITFAMFAGRLGPIALALMIGSQKINVSIRYPEERINVG